MVEAHTGARFRLSEGARQRALSRLAGWVALAVLLAAFAAPVAGAEQRTKSEVPPVVVEVHDGGFHWTDAAIGAAAALGLVCVAGVALLARRTASR